jgi:hypothetical protein
MHYKIIFRHVRVTTVAMKKKERKKIYITNSVCMSVALDIQDSTCTRRITCILVLLSVTCLASPYLSILSHKRHNFRKKTLWDIKCVFIFSITLSQTFLIRPASWFGGQSF